MHETLVAYIEGTLSAEERTTVQRRLQQSSTWQQELTHVQNVQSELQRQMPFLGRGTERQLEALLPEILTQATRPKTRRHNWWKGLQIITMMTAVFGVLMIVPIVLQSASADAPETLPPNVPRNTSTPHNTMGDGQRAAASETEEPETSSRAAFYTSISYTQGVPVHCEASPVPMPKVTSIPGN
jgi:anti-sigma factor RsiW